MAVSATNGLKLHRLGGVKVYIVTGVAPGAARPTPPGSVMIPRRNAKKPGVYGTIYEALRSRVEILLRYGVRGSRRPSDDQDDVAELDGLEAMRRRIAETHCLLAASDKDAANAFDAIAAQLARKSNPFKSEARAKAKAGAVMNGESLNPGASRARLTAIDRRIELRQEEVSAIAPWIGAMEIALILELRRSIEMLREMDADVRLLCKHPLFKSGAATGQQLNGIVARLTLGFQRTHTLLAAPYVGFRDALAPLLLDAIVATNGGDGIVLKERLDSIRAVTARALLQKRIEDLITLLVVASRTCKGKENADLRKAVDDLRRRLEAYLRNPELREGDRTLMLSIDERLRETEDAVTSGDMPKAKEVLIAASRSL